MIAEAMKKAPYHHGDLREVLVAAGRRLLEEKGLRGFTLRECARRAEVSHAAPAHHFASIDDLLAEIATRGYHELCRHGNEAKRASRTDRPAGRAGRRLHGLRRRQSDAVPADVHARSRYEAPGVAARPQAYHLQLAAVDAVIPRPRRKCSKRHGRLRLGDDARLHRSRAGRPDRRRRFAASAEGPQTGDPVGDGGDRGAGRRRGGVA